MTKSAVHGGRAEKVGRLIGLGRAAFGVAGLASPSAVARYGKLNGLDNTDGAYMTRLWAARDLVIGVASVAGPIRRPALIIGASFDAVDTWSGLQLRAAGDSRASGTSLAGVAGTFAVLGALAVVAGAGRRAS